MQGVARSRGLGFQAAQLFISQNPRSDYSHWSLRRSGLCMSQILTLQLTPYHKHEKAQFCFPVKARIKQCQRDMLQGRLYLHKISLLYIADYRLANIAIDCNAGCWSWRRNSRRAHRRKSNCMMTIDRGRHIQTFCLCLLALTMANVDGLQ